jgi:hypothetical protein
MDMKEKLENKIEINDTEVEMFEQFLSFLYTGKFDKIESFAQKKLFCTQKYGIKDLKKY